jgi:hypothetical protein
VTVRGAQRQQGAAILTTPDGRSVEMATYTCAHCNSIHRLQDELGQKLDPGGFCMQCFAQICGPCADDGRCTPFEKVLLQMEARGRLLKNIVG